MTDKLLDQKEAADFLGVTPSGLNKWRMRGAGPRYIKLSPGPRGRVRYRESDLQAFVESRLKGADAQPVA